MSNNSWDDFGEKIKKSIDDAVGKADFTPLKEFGTAAEKAVKDIGNNISQTFETRNSQNSQMQKQQGPYEPEVQETERQKQQSRPAWAGTNYNSYDRKAKRKNAFSVLPIVLGIVGVVGFALSFLILMLGLLFSSDTSSVLFGIVISLLGGAVSIAAINMGSGRRKYGKRINTYCDLLETNQVLTVNDLAGQTGIAATQIKKDVKKAIAKGLMPQVRFDTAEETLFYGEEAYQEYMDTETERQKLEREEAERLARLNDPKTADLEKFKIDNRATLAKIRQAQDSIKNEAMKTKIQQLEDTAEDIFTYVEKHPEKMPDIRKLVAYYLPTLLKLLAEYQKYEQMDVEMKDVTKAKKDIMSTLDTANTAFANLFESLYKDDTLDVKTDIKVFNAMLKQEGLTDKEFDLEADK